MSWSSTAAISSADPHVPAIGSTSRRFARESRTMAPSRSPLNRQSIVEAMTELLGPRAVETGDEQLREASVDRFKKYTSVHAIYDAPTPAAIVYPGSATDVAAVLRFADENLVNVVP